MIIIICNLNFTFNFRAAVVTIFQVKNQEVDLWYGEIKTFGMYYDPCVFLS